MTVANSIINFINTGSGVNSGDGDSLRTAFNKVNANFQNLLGNFVAAGVSSFNSQTGIVTFTGTDIINQLGFTPYPASNPLGFISSGTINFENFASTDYVNSNFVSNADLTSYNFATQNLLDAKLSEYPTLVYLDNQGFIVPSTLPNFLTAYTTFADLEAKSIADREFTTSTIFQTVNNSNLIPSVADLYTLGDEAYRWSTLYLSNAVYIGGIGISVDPVTGRLFVDGNSVTGGYILTPTSISNGDNLSFTLSATTFPSEGTSKAYIRLPSDTDTSNDPLLIYNTGTKGISFSGSQTNITIDRDSIGISVNTHFINPLRFQGNSAISVVNTTGNHTLEIRGNDSFNVGSQTIESYQQIVSFSEGSHESLVIKGSRINLFAFEKLDSQPYDLENPAFLSLDETGFYVGYNYARGHGAPGRTFDTFEGYKLPLDRGGVGQVLAITSTGTVVDNVEWVTLTGGGNLQAVASHILPAANLTYDLGSTSSQWRSLYVGTSTIYLGGTALSIDPSGLLTINGNAIGSDRLENGVHNITLNVTGNFIPGTDNLQDLGSPSNRFRHLYVGPGSVTIGSSVITESQTGKLVLPGVTRATTLFADEVEDTGDQVYSFGGIPFITDAYDYGVRAGAVTPPAGYVKAEYSVDELDDEGYIDGINIDEQGLWTEAIADTNRRNSMYAYVGPDINEPFDVSNWVQIPFIVSPKANDVEYEFSGADLGDFSIDGDILEADQMTIKTNDGSIHITSDTHVYVQSAGGSKQWSFANDGVLTLPENGDIVDSNGSSVLGGGGNNNYTPEVPEHWNEPTVNTVAAALDELAARITAIQNYEIDGGNAYTPPQGELIVDGNGA